MSFPGARQLGIRGPATGIKKLGLMTGPENGPSATPTPTPSAFDPATIFGAGDNGGYWSLNSLSNAKQLSAGTTAVATAGDAIGYLADLSGKGHHLRAKHDYLPSGSGGTDGTIRPVLAQSGAINYAHFDGANTFLAASNLNDDANGTRFTLPIATGWTRVWVGRPWATANGQCFLCPSSTFTHMGITLADSSAGTSISLDDGTVFSSGLSMDNSTFYVWIEEHKSAATTLQRDAGTVASGNSGSTDTGGLCIGAGIFLGFAKIDLVEILVINRLLTTTEKNNLRTKFGSDIGKTI